MKYLFYVTLTILVLCFCYNKPTKAAVSSIIRDNEASSDEVIVVIAEEPTRKTSTNITEEIYYNCNISLPASSIKSDPKRQEQCCDRIINKFARYWYVTNWNLGDYLFALREWGCDYFVTECEIRTFAFVEYTELLYDRFCNETVFFDKCEDELRDIANHYSQPAVEEGSGSESNESNGLIESLRNNFNLTVDEQHKTCVQAAMLDIHKTNFDSYFELSETQMPFCGFVWCGFRRQYLQENSITDWTCAPTRCRINMVILNVVACIISFAMVVANATVLAVFGMTPRLINSQGVYKISLAVADLLCGMFVYTTFVSTSYKSFATPYTVEWRTREYDNGTEYEVAHIIASGFSVPYFNFVGFFTSLSLSASIYTLMMASFDRFMVVYHPLRYNQFDAKSLARKICVVLWILCFIFSIMPFFVKSLNYGVLSTVLIALGGESAVLLYVFAFLLPLFMVWVSNIATYCFTKRNSVHQPRIENNHNRKGTSIENQLAKTLGIMVGVFTASLVPTATILITSMFIPYIYHVRPKQLHPFSYSVFISSELTAAYILMANSLWNYFIYNGRSAEFKAAKRQIYKRLIHRIRHVFLCNPYLLTTKDYYHNSNSTSTTHNRNTSSFKLSHRGRRTPGTTRSTVSHHEHSHSSRS